MRNLLIIFVRVCKGKIYLMTLMTKISFKSLKHMLSSQGLLTTFTVGTLFTLRLFSTYWLQMVTMVYIILDQGHERIPNLKINLLLTQIIKLIRCKIQGIVKLVTLFLKGRLNLYQLSTQDRLSTLFKWSQGILLTWMQGAAKVQFLKVRGVFRKSYFYIVFP